MKHISNVASSNLSWMYRVIMLFVITLCVGIAQAQNINRVEYFIDTDPGFGLATSISFTASANINIPNSSIAVTSLSNGFHTFYVRARDVNGKWSITHNRAFYKESISLNGALPNVNKAEYFVDTDPGFGSGTNIPLTAGTNVSNIALTASITSLSTGFHTFYVRVRDANGKWSITHNRAFYKEDISLGGSLANVNKAEYFFDTDPGFGLGINMPFTAGTNVTNIALTASITSLANGFHTFYVRVRDANGKWSITHNRAFYKESISLNSPLANINKAEYFFDTDPGFGLGSNIIFTPTANVTNLNFQADVNGLSIGAHKIYTRVQDANGKWSIINIANFDVVPPSTPEITTSNIVGSPFCAGQAIAITFTANTSFGIGNVFTAQLSNASGVFPITPIVIGTLTSATAGTINAILPIGTTVGSGYRIRVVASNPVIVGTANSNNLVINPFPSVSFTPLTNVSISTAAFPLSGGNPVGGVYSGTGVNANTFDPNVAGLGTFVITYTFTTAAGCSSSATSSIVVNPIINAPSSLTATAVSTSQINLSWVDNSTNNTSFRIERALNVGGPFSILTTVAENATTFSNTGLSPATTFFYRVIAQNNTGGFSANSNVATATTQNNATSQTITFNSPVLTFGVSPVNLVANASSGLPVSFSIQSGGAFASLSGTNNSVLSVLGAGTIIIRASQAGNASFLPAPDVDNTVIINKANPVITWSTPVAITFPAAISATQLNATANTAGAFIYNPEVGTVLNAGSQSLSTTFTPTNTANFNTVTVSVTQVVNKANPVLTFNNPADIEFPTQLSGTQLNANASVAGTFVYNPGNGTSLPAGNGQTLTANFTPTSSNFNPGSVTAQINVLKGNPVISWANPTAINVGTALSGTQLNATANVSGTFSYNPAAGTVLPAGNNQTLNTIFTPTDASNYNNTSASVQINVNSLINPVITWATPSAITFGTALSAAQLNATANTPGTFSYSPTLGTILNAGNQTLSVLFTPTDGSTFNTANASVTIVVNKANPILTWATPSAITFGTALSGTQLNASANVAGTFTYNPLSGSIPNAGTQTLSVSFVPSSANYNNGNASVPLLVNKATPIISWANPANITVGTALSATQLNASANIAGTFVYNPNAGTLLALGNNQVLNTTFTPTNVSNYNSAIASVQINVIAVPTGNCTASGTILYELWQGVSGNLISNIPVATLPNLTIQRTSFEGYVNSADNYGSRFRGYVCAPQTGNYVFYIASDDQGKLFLSTDDNPANKVEIASVDGFTGSREWNKFPSQQSVAIPLIAGQRYYIEALQKESTGGDNLAVGWKLPNNLLERPIAGNRLSPFDPGINLPPTIAISLPNNNSFYGIGASIPVNATARDIYGFVQQVEFFVNGVSAGVDNRSPYTTTLTNLLAGVYTITAVATDDDGMQTTSSLINIEVTNPIEAECLATGTIEREVWNGVQGTNIFQIPLSTSPSAILTLTSFEGPQNAGDNYGARIRGYVCPPQTGYYYFYIASDDKSELWLSSDSTLTNAVRIAFVNSFTNFRQWNKFPNQKSASINLLAGKKYYIHALHKEGSQFDHLSVGWELPDGTLDRPISGLYLAPYIEPTIGRMNVVSNTYSNNWLDLNVYPNPFSTETRIEWKSGITAATQILLFDMNGRVVKKIFEGNSTENQTYFYNLNAETLDAGIYTLKVITNENVNQQKIVFTK